jgi:PAS domain S-box-containing protein
MAMDMIDKKKDGWRHGVFCLVVLLSVYLPTPAFSYEQLRIGVPLGFPPFSYQDDGEREVRGYSVDILDILCESLSAEPRYLVGKNEDLLRALKDGDLDLIVGIVMDEKQQQQFNYMEILIYVKRYLFVHHQGKIMDQSGFMGVKSVVVRSQPHAMLGIADKESDFIQVRSTKEALMMVNSGHAQEFTDYSDQLAIYLIGKHGFQNVRQAGVQMGRFPFTMIIAKDNKLLSSGLSQAMGTAIKSGQLGQVREKWLGKSYASYLWERFAPLFILFAAMMAVVVFLFFAWHIALQRKVTQITSKLKVSEERYRQLIESSPDMVFLINKKGWIRLANHSASERLVIPQDQLLLSKLQALVVRRDAVKLNMFLKQLFSHGMASLETMLTNFSGRDISVEIVAARLRRSSEEELLACCFSRDLTKRKLMERELIGSERMATIGKMAAGVAHEVNNPIGIILAHTEDLISGELDAAEAQDSLNAIRRNALRAGNITRALLDQASSDESERVKLDLAVLIEDCLHFLKPRLKKISETREFEVEKHWVWGDENQLQQVFINLMLNSIESMSGVGTLRLNMAEHKTEKDRFHRIRIEDNGKGIPAEHRNQIFDPFFTKGKTQGVGLGLFVAERILKNHGGKIAAENSVMGGTVMIVDLPVNSEKTNGNAPANC